MIPTGVKVFLASEPVDFRKGPDGLLSLVRDSGADPFGGALYVFRAKRKDRIKIVWWDGSGVCLYAKRLGVKSGMAAPTASQRALTVRSALPLRTALSLEKAISMGLKSGL